MKGFFEKYNIAVSIFLSSIIAALIIGFSIIYFTDRISSTLFMVG